MEEIGIIHFTNYAKGQSRASMSAVMQYTMQESTKIHYPEFVFLTVMQFQSILSKVLKMTASKAFQFRNARL